MYHLLQDKIDDRFYIILAVEPGSDGPYETDVRAEKDKKIGLKAGRYIRVRRDSRKPNKREEFELLKKFADFHFTSELNETATLDDLNYEYISDSEITIPKMAEASGASARTVKRYLKEFQDGNVLKREGSDTSGKWILF